MFIDSHAHLTDPKLFPQIEEVRSGYIGNGVGLVVDVGCCLESSYNVSKNAETYDEVYFTAGCHPDACNEVDSKALEKIEELSKHKKCLAIGEIGLDYYYEGYDRELQKKAFISQLELAVKLDMPVIIHSRDAWQDTVDILKEYAPKLKKGFLMHCYSGSIEIAKILLKLGAYFSFGGALTFKNSKKSEVAKALPIDRIFLETDCPFMAPVPYRGKINEPKFVVEVYKFLAGVYNLPLETLETQIEENFRKFFNM
ncbi:MAG: TatD family deoxyribonuclease [Clostridiales bacterium]|nr:TatD family deoxyribonuclease [Clostridiales bacterium]